MFNSTPARLSISLICGAFLACSFSPIGYWWLVFFSLAVFFKLHLSLTPREAFSCGLSFGLGLYLVGVSWVYVSLNVYGGMPLWMAMIAVLGFCSLLAIFVALPSLIAAKIYPRLDSHGVAPAHRLMALVSAWLIFEWCKSWVFTGFPWLDIGYTQTPSWLFSLAPVGGVYLVSAAVLVSAASIALITHCPRKNIISPVAAILLIVWLGSLALAPTRWATPSGEAVVVAVVQPNTPINSKWQASYRQTLMQNLVGASEQLIAESSELPKFIVWPETALPFYHQQMNNELWQSLKHPNVGLLTGLVDSPDLRQSYNAAVLLCDGDEQLYRKRHLVPFGEYLPLRFLFNWVLEYLELPMSDFAAWSEKQTLQCGESLNVGLSICYEDAFADEHRKYNGDANMLVNISEDAWFGDSFAPHQRLQMAQMRARELARQMVRSANSGPSAFIDEYGRVVQQTSQFEPASFTAKVQPLMGVTPYQRYGNWIIYIAGLLLSLSVVRALLTQRKPWA